MEGGCVEVFEIVCKQCGKHIKVDKIIHEDPSILWDIRTEDDEVCISFVDEKSDVLVAKCLCGNDVTDDLYKIINP